MSSKYDVTLYVYDLSNGMAKTFAPMFIGKHLEGIWHTSIVVYGKETYYSGGICFDLPKTTQFGVPVKEIFLGHTEIEPEDFQCYLKDIEDEYTFDNYHIFKKNCNHFSDTVAQFLLGKGIPQEILEQVKEYENTPIGKMIEGFQVNLQQNQNGYNMNNFTQPQTQVQPQVQPQVQTQSDIIEIQDAIHFAEIISGKERVVIDFYATWCKPCHMIKPHLTQLAHQNKQLITVCSLNVDNIDTKEICVSLQVNSMPTFISFFKGEQHDRMSGANPMNLSKFVDKLKNL